MALPWVQVQVPQLPSEWELLNDLMPAPRYPRHGGELALDRILDLGGIRSGGV